MSQPKLRKNSLRVAAVIPAAGSGARLSSRIPKPYVQVAGKPLLIRTLEALRNAFHFSEIIVSIEPSRIELASKIIKKNRLSGIWVTAGGSTRAESVRNAVRNLRTRPHYILIHDAARPLVTKQTVRKVLSKACEKGAALCALPVTSTVKRAAGIQAAVIATENRNELFLAQTPQVFKASWLLSRYAELGSKALSATDEAALFDGTKKRVYLVPGESRNIKITTQEDLDWATQTLKPGS